MIQKLNQCRKETEMAESKKPSRDILELTRRIVMQNEKILEMNLLIIRGCSTPTIVIERKENKRWEEQPTM